MLVDEVRVRVRGGRGGNGCVAFRREKYVPRGGPAGGDGGRGGDVILVADAAVHTLSALRSGQLLAAGKGTHGEGSRRAGRSGDDHRVTVAVGTVVWDLATGEPLGDLSTAGQTLVVARGGAGGRGNARFATSVNRTPRWAEMGEPGEERELRLELKLLADIGLVGMPNAGKSSLLAAVSAARPLVADYPFTTTEPHLGMVAGVDGHGVVWADIPGLVAGASRGVGLGNRFLRHIERTRVLLLVVDAAGCEGRSPEDDLAVIAAELASYGRGVASRPWAVVANKLDLPAGLTNFARLVTLAQERGWPVFGISAATRAGVAELVAAAGEMVAKAGGLLPALTDGAPSPTVLVPAGVEPDFWVEPSPRGYLVQGPAARRWARMTPADQPDALRHLEQVLRRRGVFRAARRVGARVGDPLWLADMEFRCPER